MTHEFFLLHRAGPLKFNNLEPQQFSFKTCMRHIVLSPADSLENLLIERHDGDEVFRGDDAYRFLLQVICGLHSPLVGETEVYGQFKNAVAEFSLHQSAQASSWTVQLGRLFRSLFEDAKKIRSRHLKDLGSQSYGSLMRRELKGVKRVDLLGAGHLVQEILPWIAKDGVEIHLHVRNVVKAKEAITDERVHFHAIGDHALDGSEALIVAAQVSADWLQGWIGTASLQAVADLRDTWQTDPLTSDRFRVLQLGSLFAKIAENQTVLVERKNTALSAVETLVQERTRLIENRVENRPFGWDDVCA